MKNMVLIIKESKNKEEQEISMNRDPETVFIMIDEVCVAHFKDNGIFKFFGTEDYPKYEARWKK